MHEPAFWYRPSSWVSLLLTPLGAIYGLVAGWRLQREGFDAGIETLALQARGRDRAINDAERPQQQR